MSKYIGWCVAILLLTLLIISQFTISLQKDTIAIYKETVTFYEGIFERRAK